jgi:hypothetical protein
MPNEQPILSDTFSVTNSRFLKNENVQGKKYCDLKKADSNETICKDTVSGAEKEGIETLSISVSSNPFKAADKMLQQKNVTKISQNPFELPEAELKKHDSKKVKDISETKNRTENTKNTKNVMEILRNLDATPKKETVLYTTEKKVFITQREKYLDSRENHKEKERINDVLKQHKDQKEDSLNTKTITMNQDKDENEPIPDTKLSRAKSFSERRNLFLKNDAKPVLPPKNTIVKFFSKLPLNVDEKKLPTEVSKDEREKLPPKELITIQAKTSVAELIRGVENNSEISNQKFEKFTSKSPSNLNNVLDVKVN